MSKRRGGAPHAAAGLLWRQQQKIAQLSEVLRQLPTGTSLPVWLLREVQRVLICAEQLLQPHRTEEGAEHDGPGAGTGVAGHQDSNEDWSTESEYGKMRVWGTGLAEGGGGGGDSAGRQSREDVVAAQVVVQLQEIVVTAVQAVTASRSSEERGAYESECANNVRQNGMSTAYGMGWRSAEYVVALLHHFLALSSDLFDELRRDADGGANTGGSGGCGSGAPLLLRDDLAVVARRRLPVAVYLRVVAVCGWEPLLLDLLVWMPPSDGGKGCTAAADTLTRVVRQCPALAPGMAALLAAEGGAWQYERQGRMGDLSGAEQAACTARWLSRTAMLAQNPVVLRALAEVVMNAAAAGAEAVGASGPAPGPVAVFDDGARWLPCLWLLGEALADALRCIVVRSSSAAGVGQPPAAVAKGDAEVWCEALQEGLCAWQGILMGAEVRMGGGSGDVSTSRSSVAAVAAVRQVCGKLLGLLEELQRRQQPNAAGTTHVVQQSQSLLSAAAIVRLRSRIVLLNMQIGGAPPSASGECGAAESSVASDGGGGGSGGDTTVSQLLTADDVWRRNPPTTSSAGTSIGTAGSTATGAITVQRPLPEWLRSAVASSITPSAAASAGAYLRPMGLSSPIHSLLASVVKQQRRLVGRRTALSTQIAEQTRTTIQQYPATATAMMTSSVAARERVVAIAVALLTPGLGSWLSTQTDPRVNAAAGADPYSPFRMALALCEMLYDGSGCIGSDVGSTSQSSTRRSSTHELVCDGGGQSGRIAAVEEGRVGAGEGRSEALGKEEQDVAVAVAAAAAAGQRHLEWLVVHMVVECLAGVGSSEQQRALQGVAAQSPVFKSSRARFAADAELQSAAARSLVALSNRSAALEGSLEHTALSIQQEAQRLAAAAQDLLPFAVLVPEACVRRLVYDGLTHVGQQPWVLQLLSCFAVATAADTDAASASGECTASGGYGIGGYVNDGEGCMTTVLLACLRGVLQDAPRVLRTTADRRSLLGLMDGLLRAGLAAPRRVLAAVVGPALVLPGGIPEGSVRQPLPSAEAAVEVEAGCQDDGSGGGGNGGDGPPTAQLLAALQLALHILGGGAGAGVQPLPYNPSVELAAARPVRLLLTVATVLSRMYEKHDKQRQLEAAVLDTAVAVLERGVKLYSEYLAAYRTAGVGTTPVDEGLEALVNAVELFPRRVMFTMLPLLELAAASHSITSTWSDKDMVPSRGVSPGGDNVSGGSGGEGDHPMGHRGAGRDTASISRTLTAWLVPASTWRPRVLRTADPRVARAVVYDTLAFAASSVAHAVVVRQALLEVAVAAAGDEDSGSDDEGSHAVGQEEPGGARGRPTDRHVTVTNNDGEAGWMCWDDDELGAGGSNSVVCTDANTQRSVITVTVTTSTTVAGAADGSHHEGGLSGLPSGRNAHTLARHAAATAARGLPLLPPSHLYDGTVAALADLLPSATSDQARRVLLAVLPAFVPAAWGGRALGRVLAERAMEQQQQGGRGKVRELTGTAVVAEMLTWLTAPSPGNVQCRGTAAQRWRRPSPAADMAAAVALACEAAVVAVQSCWGANGGQCTVGAAAVEHGSYAAAPTVLPYTCSAAVLGAVADRCAAHLALLAARLGEVATAMVGSTSGAAAAVKQYGCRTDGSGGRRSSDGACEVAAVAMVLLSGLCQVAGVAAAVASEVEADGGPGAGARVMDVWQAIILSVLQHLVSALLALPGGAATNGGQEGDTGATRGPVERPTMYDIVCNVRHVLCALPRASSDMLWVAFERLCEDGEQLMERGLEGAGGGELVAAVARVVEAEEMEAARAQSKD